MSQTAAPPAQVQAPPAAPAVPPGIDTAVAELTRVLTSLQRDDLVTRATAAGARLRRPSTVVCVVGEFKQGKSSLVNGLLGTAVCPVDDDLATSAITLVRHGDEFGATIRRRVGDEVVAEQVPVNEVGNWVSEQGNPHNEKQVERVDLTAPSAILRQGLAIVDTPGMGGLGAGHAAATLSFLPFADGLILVSDTSAELSAPEVEFLRRARELCPTVLLVQTKIDLYQSADRIVELNRGHLARLGLDIPIVSVSSHLRLAALARKDRSLNDASHFPVLIEALGSQVVEPAKASAADRSAHDLHAIAGLVRTSLTDERRAVSDPASAQQLLDELQEATTKLEHLRGPGARWSLVVGDRVADLSNDVSYGLRGGMRTISRTMDERIEELKNAAEWDEMGRDLQTMVADEVARVFVAIETGRAAIRKEVAELLDDEDLGLSSAGGQGPGGFDVSELWQDKGLEGESKGKRAFGTGMASLRGAQGGVMMFGMMGQFLPKAAAGVLAANPVLLGAGALFGGVQLLEERKRKLAARRMAARQQVRQFIDDVQFEVTNQVTGLVRNAQRELRDEFSARLGELQATYAATAQRAQEQANRTQAESKARLAQIDASLAVLDKVGKLLGGAS